MSTMSNSQLTKTNNKQQTTNNQQPTTNNELRFRTTPNYQNQMVHS